MNELFAVLYHVMSNDWDQSTIKLSAADRDPEVLAFWCFVDLMGSFREFYCAQLDRSDVGVSGLMNRVSGAIDRAMPALSRHLEQLHITPHLYSFRWLTTLFAQEFVLPDVTVIWDRMIAIESFHMSKSDFVVQLCASMVLMKADQIMHADFATAMKILQHSEDIDVHILLQRAGELLLNDR